MSDNHVIVRRFAVFVVWSLFVGFLFFAAIFLTQMGDCFDVRECSEFKDRAAKWILIGGPVIWLAGALALARRWTR